jgi:hypothetical protein
MRAGFGVDAFVGEAEAVDGAAGYQMLADDLGGVGGLHAAVPGCVRVDDDGGAVLALIEAERLVDAHGGGEAGFAGELRELSVEFALAVGGAGWSRRAGGADVVTDEDMAFERGQTEILLVQE